MDKANDVVLVTGATGNQGGAVASVVKPERDERIRLRAYEIHRERGEQQGRELEDWLEAERELDSDRI